MSENIERFNKIKQLDEGEMGPIAEKLSRNEDVPAEDLKKYKQEFEKLLSEPLGIEPEKISNTIAAEDLADAAKVLGEEQEMALPEDKLSEAEEQTLSSFKIKADANNQMPSKEAVEEERARIVNERNRGVDYLKKTASEDTSEPEVDETPGFVEGEVRDLHWDENLDGDLRVASREPRRWKDSRDHSKGELSEDQKAEDVRKISAARDRLNSRGYNTDILQDRAGRRQAANARRVIIDGADETEDGMTMEEAEEIFDRMNIDAGKAKEEREKRRSGAGGRTTNPDDGAEDTSSRTRETKSQKLTEESVREAAEKYKDYVDPTLRSRLLGKLAEDAGKQGLPADLVNEISRLATESRDAIPHKDKFSTEIEVTEAEDKMLLRGAVIEVVGGAGLGNDVEDVYGKVKQIFLSRKGVTFGVLSPEVEANVKMEIEARLELQKTSLFWSKMKDDKNPEADTYTALKSGMGNMPLLSEGTYRWLMEEDRDASYTYVDGKTGEKKDVKCENLRAEMDGALKKFFDYINSGEDDSDLWLAMNYDQKVALFEKLVIEKENVATLAFQLAEAECWTAMRPKSYHPARKLAYLSDYRLERLTRSLSVPGGYRLLQEYRDGHEGKLPFHRDGGGGLVIDDVSVFDAEGVSLARLGLDMSPNLRTAAQNGTYLDSLRVLYEADTDEGKSVRSSQVNMRTDLSNSANVFDAFDALGKPPVGFDALGKLKGVLYPWYATRFKKNNLPSGVADAMLSYSRTFLWANSLANNIRNLDATKVTDMNKFFEETYLPLIDAVDPITGKGAYVGVGNIINERLVETRSEYIGGLPVGEMSEIKTTGREGTIKQQIEVLTNWFNILMFKKCYPILESARKDNSLAAFKEKIIGLDLAPYLIRADRNQSTMIKLLEESRGFKESLKVRLKNIVNDSSKWWNSK